MTGLAMMCPDGKTPKFIQNGTVSTVCKGGDCGDTPITTKTNGYYEWCNPDNHEAVIVLAEVIGTACFTSLALTIIFGTESKESIIKSASIGVTLFALVHLTLNSSGGCLNLAFAIVQPIF